MSGTFVAVVGSSGAGKDSVMSYARERLGADIVIVRRVVTRDADGGSEDHDSMTLDQFVAAETEGRFALSWEAHGLRYGLPITFPACSRGGVCGRAVPAVALGGQRAAHRQRSMYR